MSIETKIINNSKIVETIQGLIGINTIKNIKGAVYPCDGYQTTDLYVNKEDIDRYGSYPSKNFVTFLIKFEVERERDGSCPKIIKYYIPDEWENKK